MSKKNQSLREKLLFLFKHLNIKKNSKIMMHSNAAGVFQFKSSNYNNAVLKQIFFKNLINVLGSNGLLVLPVYNYDFPKKKPFYYDRHNSQVGEMGNFFLKKYNVIRTLNPVFSHAILKNRTIPHLNENIHDCLGKKSFFNYLHKENFKIFGFCVPTNTMTFIHYVECINNLKYRYNKKFRSFIIKNNKKIDLTIVYNVGKKKYNYTLKADKINKAISSLKSYRSLDFGRFHCWTIDSKEVFNSITNMIKKNKFYLIK